MEKRRCECHQKAPSSSANSRAAKSAIVVIATKCGAHVIVDHPTLGLIDVRIGALRNFSFKPKVDLNYAETVLPMRDGLLKLKDFPAAIGGSGKTLPE
jgi:hypothetical protein